MLIKALAAAAGNFGGGYSIENSLRFNDNDSAYLSRTPASAGNRRTWTWSGWVKRGNVGINGYLFGADTAAGSGDGFGFISSDQLKVYVNGAVTGDLVTNALFRDVGGWYHLVVSADSTQATASNRIKVYVNGEQVTSFATETYPPQNFDFDINGVFAHWLGRVYVYYFDGYMAEINFVDGQALTADDFGEIDSDTGEWSPKKYSGTYGTNGFYLAFEDGSALGDDTSGNTNDWTPTNLASTDQMLDTPTNNFATLTPTNSDASTATLSEGNLKLVTAVSGYGPSLANIGASSGKWYWEVLAQSASSEYLAIGIAQDTWSVTTGTNALGFGTGFSLAYYSNGQLSINSSTTAGWGATFTTGDIIGVALDMDAGTIEFYKNNVSQGVAYSSLSGTVLGGVSDGGNSLTTLSTSNFGQDSSFAGNKTRQGNTDANGFGDFYYTPPTGYLALCTNNLPVPAIEQPETQFNVVTYTGDGTSSNAITGVGFQPDFVWIKDRSFSEWHILNDVVRGAGQSLYSNSTDAEGGPNYFVSSFDSDGFTVNVTPNVGANKNGDSYVAWCWKAGGTAVTNTNGTITSQVSANVDAGFSIVSYTGTRTSAGNDTIGHGLGIAPSVVISKSTSNASRWVVQHSSLGTDDFLELNTTAAVADSSAVGAGALPKPTSSVFYGSWLLGLNVNTQDFIAYCFAEVEGFSKFGSYTGNGSANGPFVYTGFRPAFVMMKRTDSTSDWTLLDTSRSAYNVVSNRLWANLSAAESTAGLPLDIVSNGFKLRTSDAYANASGGSYIYMAFAESPTKFSLGR